MLRTVWLLSLAAMVGVVGATSSACVIGLISGTSTWCGLHFAWPIGFILAIPFAIVFGLPASLAFRKAGLFRWWQFVLGGSIVAAPVWYEFAQPFSSARWLSSGFFDSLIFLGTGAAAGLAYWWFTNRCAKQAL